MNPSQASSVTPLPERWADRWSHTLEWMGLGMVFIPVGERLLASYSEPERHYHDARHVLSCLNALDNFSGNIQDADALELAIWFHDAIYNPKAGPGVNEFQSAELFRKEFQMLANGYIDLDQVERLIMATRHHREPEDSDEALIMDIDLGVLGGGKVRYDVYADDIRMEYAHVDDDMFRKGRIEVIHSFLRRKSIYWTRDFRNLLEKSARANLERELVRLLG
jgi:predicted metal-dependent HD superfamily phosphohydrolase